MNFSRLILLGALVSFVVPAGALCHGISSLTVPLSTSSASIDLSSGAPSHILLSPASIPVRDLVYGTFNSGKHNGKGKGDSPVATPEAGGLAATLLVVLSGMSLLFYAAQRNIIVLRHQS